MSRVIKILSMDERVLIDWGDGNCEYTKTDYIAVETMLNLLAMGLLHPDITEIQCYHPKDWDLGQMVHENFLKKEIWSRWSHLPAHMLDDGDSYYPRRKQ